MLKPIRNFLKNYSPDWLNVEVNKNLLQNLSAAITSTQSTITSTSYDDNCSPRPELGEGLGVRADTINNERQFSTTESSLFPTPGTPHWRRIRQVFMTLDSAPLDASYNQLIEYVRETTGVGCSRKLISKWKKYRQNSDLLPPRDDRSHGGDSETNTVGVSSAMTISAAIPSTVNSFQLNHSVDNSDISDSLNRPNLYQIRMITHNIIKNKEYLHSVYA